ncbi:helix-turn-helix domain-containing protein [Winogradskyella sp. 3972H.M.0a.05]|uniref:AraC family transcriptional regulator n=1 Tax=Winogradskyella sp. 3972H.M.0a.05 TaxID=2950277 RepID=UPI003396C1A3
MKALPFQIPKPTSDALIYQEDHEYVFYDKFHLHEEIQLSYIHEGEGTLIVGDTVSDYKKGDIIAIGSNLPHVFKSDVTLETKSLMLTLFFTKDSFGEVFFDLEELSETKHFFKNINSGFKVLSHNQALKTVFLSLRDSSKLERFTSLLLILKSLAKAKKLQLSSYSYEKEYTAVEGKRMQDVMDYTMKHSHESISLDVIANVANMTKNAFCKYFKKRTNKTYTQFLNELRIENACKLISNNGELTLSEIAFQCGYFNISNFNRQFKAIKSMTPSEYRIAKLGAYGNLV